MSGVVSPFERPVGPSAPQSVEELARGLGTAVGALHMLASFAECQAQFALDDPSIAGAWSVSALCAIAGEARETLRLIAAGGGVQ